MTGSLITGAFALLVAMIGAKAFTTAETRARHRLREEAELLEQLQKDQDGRDELAAHLAEELRLYVHQSKGSFDAAWRWLFLLAGGVALLAFAIYLSPTVPNKYDLKGDVRAAMFAVLGFLYIVLALLTLSNQSAHG